MRQSQAAGAFCHGFGFFRDGYDSGSEVEEV